MAKNMRGLIICSRRKTLSPALVRCAHRAARATATLPEPALVENLKDYPRGL